MTAEQFNRKYPIGSLVRYWPGVKEGPGTLSQTRSEAWLIGHVPCVAVEGFAGGISLTHVRPVRDAICCYVVYDKPADYPDEIVIRQHFAVANGETYAARKLFGRGCTLEYVRTLLPDGLANIGRFAGDDSTIREVWI